MEQKGIASKNEESMNSVNTKSSSKIEQKSIYTGTEVSLKHTTIIPKIKKSEQESTPLLAIDDVFRKRWLIEGLIGKGGYGEIYLAIDMKRTEEVAIKAEPKTRRGKVAKRMILEQKVLLKLQGKPHVPMIFASGHTETMNFIIMQLLSINVGEIRKSSPVKRLSRSTVGRIIIQSIAALRDLHEAGYVHRDVKPANMCFGITPKTRHVLMLLDFGLIRRFKNENGEWRAHRTRAGFRGTHRYVSIRVHSRLEQTPADDLTSLLYTGYELLVGELPWKNLEKNDEIRKLKKAMQRNESEYFTANDLYKFAKSVFELDPMTEPPYNDLQESCKTLLGNKKLSDLYDWEDEYKEVAEESSDVDTQK